jgi:hypothetical protein
MTDFAKLHVELADLNMKCQQARDNEVRYGLMRSRLEAERAQLLVKMVETIACPATPTVSVPYQVTVRGFPSGLAIPDQAMAPKSIEPNIQSQLPKLPAMIRDALQDAPGGLLPKQIIEAVHKRGAQTRPVMIYRAINRMLKGGRIGRVDKRYSVPRSNGAHP